MKIQLHAIDFAFVDTNVQKYYVEKTNSLFNSHKELRRLFVNLSDVILCHGSMFIGDVAVNKFNFQEHDGLLLFDFPKSYFKDVLSSFRFLLESIKYDMYCDVIDPLKALPLYRNIKHLIFVTAYQAKFKGYEYL